MEIVVENVVANFVVNNVANDVANIVVNDERVLELRRRTRRSLERHLSGKLLRAITVETYHKDLAREEE